MDQRRIDSAERSNARAIARQFALPWYLFAAALALATWALWRAFGPASYGDPLATSLTAFEKANRLTVFSAQLAPVVAADDERLMGLIKSRQIAVIPARVDYTLDLSKMTRTNMVWDEQAQRLTVTLPALTVSRPNLDEGRAQYLREGVWITRTAQDELTRANTRLAEQQAVQQASNPVLLNLARAAAKDAVRQNLSAPLKVSGHPQATVIVRVEGETAQ
ncbi:MAG: DUF4230 domain-containing protein [Novosphingobium sp.]